MVRDEYHYTVLDINILEGFEYIPRKNGTTSTNQVPTTSFKGSWTIFSLANKMGGSSLQKSGFLCSVTIEIRLCQGQKIIIPQVEPITRHIT